MPRRSFWAEVDGLPRCDPRSAPVAENFHLHPLFKGSHEISHPFQVPGSCIPLSWCPIVGIDAVAAHLRSAPPPLLEKGVRSLDDWRLVDGWQIGQEHSGIPPRMATGWWFLVAPWFNRQLNSTVLHCACAYIDRSHTMFVWSRHGVLYSSYTAFEKILESHPRKHNIESSENAV